MQASLKVKPEIVSSNATGKATDTGGVWSCDVVRVHSMGRFFEELMLCIIYIYKYHDGSFRTYCTKSEAHAQGLGPPIL